MILLLVTLKTFVINIDGFVKNLILLDAAYKMTFYETVNISWDKKIPSGKVDFYDSKIE